MAVSGGATVAYRVQIFDGQIMASVTTKLRSECVSVEKALPLLARGETVPVAGGDMAELRRRLTEAMKA